MTQQNMQTIFTIRLKELVKDDNIKKELATYLNTSVGVITHYLNGKYMPNVQALYSIAKYFNVSIDYLLGNEIAQINEYKSLLNETLNKFDMDVIITCILNYLIRQTPTYAEQTQHILDKYNYEVIRKNDKVTIQKKQV